MLKLSNYFRPMKTFWPVYLVLLAMVIAVIFYFLRVGVVPSDSAGWGTFGDFVGGTINPLVGLCTMLLLIGTLNLQREELRAQREQLAATTAETARQNSILAMQAFEQSFFLLQANYFRARDAVRHIQAGEEEESEEETYGLIALERQLRSVAGAGFNSRELPLNVRQALRTVHLKKELSADQEAINASAKIILARWETRISAPATGILRMLTALGILLSWVDASPQIDEDRKLIYVQMFWRQLSPTEMNAVWIHLFLDMAKDLKAQIAKHGLDLQLHVPQYSAIRYLKYLDLRDDHLEMSTAHNSGI